MKFLHYTLIAGFATLSLVAADSVTCNSTSKCPENLPCCSLYGECGTGSYCLGPCDPKLSYNISACVPAPICKSGDIKFTNLDNIVKNTAYLGDSSSHDFVSNNDVVSYDDSVLLTMANGSTGTVLTSSRAIWYGKVSATLKTSRTQGVVSSLILMSGVRDEIDYEFIGSYLESAQTNFYWQEVMDWTHAKNISLSNTYMNYHTYEVDWTEDSITWYIDGQVGRTLNKSDTYNSTTDSYAFPQTPSFVQISLWPGGLASNPQGTINWAGGEVDWNAEDLKNPGYFYVTLKDVSITCYDPPSGTNTSGSTSYVYKNTAGLVSDIEITNDTTVLGSFEACGFDMNKGSDDNLATASGSVPTGVGSGNNHSADDSNVPSASAVSISSTSSSTGSSSIADASQVSTSKPPSKTTSEGSSKKTGTTATSGSNVSTASSSESSQASASASALASASSSDAGGFQQAGSSASTATTKNSAYKEGAFTAATIAVVALLSCILAI